MDYPRSGDKNLLYRKFGVRVAGRQNLQTFKMDPSSLTFLDLFEYDHVYSEDYLDRLMEKAAPAWKDVGGADAWLEELRGGTDA